MYYSEAKNKKVGDWIGCKGYAEDAIILDIKDTIVNGKKTIVFTLMFETYGKVTVDHRRAMHRLLWKGSALSGDEFLASLLDPEYQEDTSGDFSYEHALNCPSVNRLKLTETTNEDLFKLWGVPNPFQQ